MSAPLSGLTVLEAPRTAAARYCGRLLVQLGAQVLQAFEPPTASVGYGGAASVAFASWLDGGKMPLRDAGRRGVDLVIGDGDEPRAASFSGALRLDLTWFDRRGPYRDWQGTDALIQALAGIAYPVGPIEGPPLLPRGHAPQIVAGATAFIAAMGGLIGRRNGWEGRRIDVDILTANLCFMESQACGAAMNGDKAVRRGVNQFTTYPGGVYRAADGWVGVTALTPAQWTAFCDLIGLPELGRNGRYLVMSNRLADAADLEPLLCEALLRQPALYWVEEGQRRRIPLAPMPTLADLPATPHWRERGSFAPVTEASDATGPTMPFRFHEVGAKAERRPRHSGAALPLQGINVLDLSMGWAGPLAARHFADLGADVVKVESCGYFDWWRGWDGDMSADPPPYETRPSFLMVNRNKRGITLDFKMDEGRALLRRLASWADVLIENHAPGVLDKLGVGALGLAEANPGLIALSMGAFGSRGRWRGFRAYGSTVEQASGLPFVNGRPEDPPTMQHVAYGDPVAGLFGAIACLAALYARAAPRAATWIDLSQVECLFQLGADAIVAQSVQSDPLPREGSAHPASLLRTCVSGAEPDTWLAVSIETLAQLEAARQVVGDASGTPLEEALPAWSAVRSVDDAASALQQAGVPAAPVRPSHALLFDPQLSAVGFWESLDRAFVGRRAAPRPPIRLDGESPPLKRPAPTLGQHNAEVLGETAGLDAVALAALERRGVIGTRATIRAE